MAIQKSPLPNYFHQPPFHDTSTPVAERARTCDFVISTEVFEHVVPPVARAFSHTFDLLKQGGHSTLTVPFTNAPTTLERFADLHDYRIIQFGQDYVLVNRTNDGRYALHDKPCFYSGPGTTLEMRISCRKDIINHLIDADFTDVKVLDDDVSQWGILHKHPWSFLILARRSLSELIGTPGAENSQSSICQKADAKSGHWHFQMTDSDRIATSQRTASTRVAQPTANPRSYGARQQIGRLVTEPPIRRH